jgi:hypothetical protein
LNLSPEDGAVAFGSDLVVIHVAAALRAGLEVLAARLDPLHRFAELSREEADEKLFGVDIRLASEASADLGRDHAHLMLGDAERSGGDGAE